MHGKIHGNPNLELPILYAIHILLSCVKTLSAKSMSSFVGLHRVPHHQLAIRTLQFITDLSTILQVHCKTWHSLIYPNESTGNKLNRDHGSLQPSMSSKPCSMGCLHKRRKGCR